jgi:hypothetical protein
MLLALEQFRVELDQPTNRQSVMAAFAKALAGHDDFGNG